jgi:putative glutamine transport system substrate-binding protein
MLVKRASGITGLKDCNGKAIGVAQSATSRKAIQEAADKLGVKISFSEFATYPEIKAALDSGRVDVFSVDKSILNGYLDDQSVILPDAFSPQEYGVTSKLDNKPLAGYIDALVQKWLKDGTIAGLIKQFEL